MRIKKNLKRILNTALISSFLLGSAGKLHAYEPNTEDHIKYTGGSFASGWIGDRVIHYSFKDMDYKKRASLELITGIISSAFYTRARTGTKNLHEMSDEEYDEFSKKVEIGSTGTFFYINSKLFHLAFFDKTIPKKEKNSLRVAWAIFTGVPVTLMTIDNNEIEEDKVLHFGANFLISTTSYGTTRYFTKNKEKSRTIAGITSTSLCAIASVGKEVYDKANGGEFSKEDLYADFLGALTGLGTSVLFDKIAEKNKRLENLSFNFSPKKISFNYNF